MRVVAEPDRCGLHGLCSMVDDELFPLNDEGRIAIDERGIKVPPGKEDLAREGVNQCPCFVLRIEE